MPGQREEDDVKGLSATVSIGVTVADTLIQRRRAIPAAAAAAMSPLARSLLALAALLAAADAIPKLPNPFCDSLSIGKEYIGNRDDSIKFKLTVSGEFYTIIPDKCTRPGRRLLHQYLRVCNPPNNKPSISLVKSSDPYTAITLDCPRDVPGCTNLELNVRQDCKMLSGPYVLPEGPGPEPEDDDM
ncbi:uncharacterized protein LOC134648198 [Cydia amplana]|uniref:uncharacterized protein LOC134648198 n=1 Tax=Cydia amplana TaxID=1869771 RepID=UPI002FE59DEE